MSIIHFANTAGADEAIITLNLNGENILHAVANGNTATAGVVIEYTSSRVEKLEGGVYTQIDAGTGDWATPNPDPAKYEVKATASPFFDNPDTGPTLGVWHTISTDREWTVTESVNDAETVSSLTIAVRKIGDATTEVTGTYTITARVGNTI